MTVGLLPRTPVVVITGFLGSGKTTLINHVLTDASLGRVAALVNDFGAVNIDAALVSSVADEVVQLTNGCICCSINGDLYAAAERTLALDPPIDRIVVETTGVADPLPVGLTFLETDLRDRTSLDAVVTVVDCANFALDLFADGAALAQIVHGDVIVLNKTDLVPPAEVETLERRIAIIKPRARTLRARYGNVPLEVLVDPIGPGLALHEGASRPEREDGGTRFCVETFRLERPVSARRFQAWCDEGFPVGVFRAKGLIRFDRPDAVFLFQLCGARAAFDPCEADVAGAELVFIGQELDRRLLDARLEACAAAGQASIEHGTADHEPDPVDLPGVPT
jgi:G3E family GTPase